MKLKLMTLPGDVKIAGDKSHAVSPHGTTVPVLFVWDGTNNNYQNPDFIVYEDGDVREGTPLQHVPPRVVAQRVRDLALVHEWLKK